MLRVHIATDSLKTRSYLFLRCSTLPDHTFFSDAQHYHIIPFSQTLNITISFLFLRHSTPDCTFFSAAQHYQIIPFSQTLNITRSYLFLRRSTLADRTFFSDAQHYQIVPFSQTLNISRSYLFLRHSTLPDHTFFSSFFSDSDTLLMRFSFASSDTMRFNWLLPSGPAPPCV